MGTPKTDDEIATLAADIYKGVIFTSRHLPSGSNMIAHVFMPLLFMEGEQLERLKIEDPGLIYEYWDKAESRSINGYPIFMSLQYLSRADTVKVFERFERIKAAVESVNQPVMKETP